MNKRLLLLVAMVLVATMGWAQDAKAKKILDEVSAKTNSLNSLFAEFIFSTENEEMEISESNTGTITIVGKKYNLKMKGLQGSAQESEIIMEVFSDGNSLWNYMRDGNQVLISDIDDESNELMEPSSIFTIYERGFNSEFVSEKQMANKTVYLINLFPDSDEFEVNKIEVVIDKAKMMIAAATLFATDGNLYKININKMEEDKDFPASMFTFDESKYDDVEVIDLR